MEGLRKQINSLGNKPFNRNISEKTAILFSHSARIRCILNNFTVYTEEGQIDLMSFFRRLVDEDDHNKFENCACILIKKDNQGYYFYLIHDGGETNTKRITNIKILDNLDPPPRIQPDELPPNYIIGININPKQNKGIEECFKKYTNLLIVRHGKGWHNKHRFLKKIDPRSSKKWNSPLIKDGRDQSEAAGEAIARYFTAQEYDIFASVLRRTAESAFYFMKAFMKTTIAAFFLQHPIYIIPCNDEVDDKSPEEDCNKSYSQLNPKPCRLTMRTCQNTENRLKDTDVLEPYIPPDIFDTSGMIKGTQYHVFPGILFAECQKSVFSYLDPELVLNPVLNFAQDVITGRVDGGSLKKKKKRRTIRRKSKRFTKKRFTKKRFTKERNKRRTNKKKRLTNKRRTNKKKRLTKRR